MSRGDYSIFDILPCACGSPPVAPKSGEAQRIECEECGMAGPIGGTPEQVVHLWNEMTANLRIAKHDAAEMFALCDEYLSEHNHRSPERCECGICQQWRRLYARITGEG